MVSRFHCRDRNLEVFGGLAKREALDFAEHEHGAKLRRKGSDCLFERVPHFILRHSGFGIALKPFVLRLLQEDRWRVRGVREIRLQRDR